MNGNYDNPFSVCFNMMKMKYVSFDESLSSKHFFQEHDKVNVFFNMESMLKLLSMIPELEKKLRLNRDFKTILISDILNIAGHYKRFFCNNGLDTRVYLYSTSLGSDIFPQAKYNEDFRSYYLVKYNDNPRFSYFTDNFRDNILPDTKTYCQFIPDIYYIETTNIDSGVVPYVFAQEDPNRKNVVISGDWFDSQYELLPNFLSYIITIGGGSTSASSNVESYLRKLMGKPTEEDVRSQIEIFGASHEMYVSLLSVLDDKSRSINGLNGIGVKRLESILRAGIERKEITLGTKSPESISEVFHDREFQNDFINNFNCLSVPLMYQDMTQMDKEMIINQRIDRLDMNAILKINATVFSKHRLTLEALFSSPQR